MPSHYVENVLSRGVDTDLHEVAVPSSGKGRVLSATLEHPGGGLLEVKVRVEQMTKTGLRLLHRGFLHQGTTISLDLPRRDKSMRRASGQVRTCTYRPGNHFYDVEVGFDEPLPRHVLAEIDLDEGDKDAVASMEGLPQRVLYLDDSAIDQRMAGFRLEKMGIKLHCVRKIQEAVDAVRRESFDVLLCDFYLEGTEDAMAAIPRLRDSGFSAPIILVTAEMNPNTLSEARACGADAVLTKPYDTDTLARLLLQVQHEMGAGVPILYSSLSDDPVMHAPLVEYAEHLGAMARDIERGMLGEKVEEVRRLCLRIHGSARGYGFELLGEAAKTAVTALDASMSCQESRPVLRRLCHLCRRMAVRSAS